MAYMLSIRGHDSEPWGKPTSYRFKRERDSEASFCRIIAGLRTHSWTETKREEAERIRIAENAEGTE